MFNELANWRSGHAPAARLAAVALALSLAACGGSTAQPGASRGLGAAALLGEKIFSEIDALVKFLGTLSDADQLHP